MTTNKHVLTWIDEMAALTCPDKIVWIDGSEAQTEALREEAVSTGEMIRLNQEKLPGCYLHRTAINDVARVENRTFICTKKKEDVGATNNWMESGLHEGQDNVRYPLLHGCCRLFLLQDRY